MLSSKEGDIHCFVHIMNITVQAALPVLEAILDKDLENYRMTENDA